MFLPLFFIWVSAINSSDSFSLSMTKPMKNRCPWQVHIRPAIIAPPCSPLTIRFFPSESGKIAAPQRHLSKLPPCLPLPYAIPAQRETHPLCILPLLIKHRSAPVSLALSGSSAPQKYCPQYRSPQQEKKLMFQAVPFQAAMPSYPHCGKIPVPMHLRHASAKTVLVQPPMYAPMPRRR